MVGLSLPRSPDSFEASHIVENVNQGQSEEGARKSIEAALAELERGEPFPEVADRHSDCKENRGNLGRFPTGEMVEEVRGGSPVIATRPAFRDLPNRLRGVNLKVPVWRDR